MNCSNALHPDSFGHYREASVTAIKHHWWWKVRHFHCIIISTYKPLTSVPIYTVNSCFLIQVNTVFDNLRVTTNFNGYVFFLEEDHYLSPDFIHVAKRLVALKREKCGDCDFVNMGTYAMKSSFEAMANQVRAGTLYIVVVMAFEIVEVNLGYCV